MITFSNASKIYPGQIQFSLQDINLKVEKGDIFGIIGFSGAGKSTLMRCLTGLEKLSSGEIFLNSTALSPLNASQLRFQRQNYGMVFQHFNLFQSRTVGQNIAYPLEILKKDKAFIEKKVDELLAKVGLKEKKNIYPSSLSGGEKQRVGIARALAGDPSLLLCDEATSALDPKSTKQILELLKSLNESLGLTILLITHEMDVVKTICNKVAVLEKGKIVETGRVKDIFAKPSHPTTKSFLASSTHALPTDMKDSSKYFLRLGFKGPRAKEPLISKLIKTHDVHVNILLGSLDCIEDTIVGNLVIELIGSNDEIKKALLFFDKEEVIYETVEF
jgi:D-methionine transport system ATP-binding protein